MPGSLLASQRVWHCERGSELQQYVSELSPWKIKKLTVAESRTAQPAEWASEHHSAHSPAGHPGLETQPNNSTASFWATVAEVVKIKRQNLMLPVSIPIWLFFQNSITKCMASRNKIKSKLQFCLSFKTCKWHRAGSVSFPVNSLPECGRAPLCCPSGWLHSPCCPICHTGVCVLLSPQLQRDRYWGLEGEEKSHSAQIHHVWSTWSLRQVIFQTIKTILRFIGSSCASPCHVKLRPNDGGRKF